MVSGSLNGQQDRARPDAEAKVSKVQKTPPSLGSTINEGWICVRDGCNCTSVCVLYRRSPTTFPKKTF